MSDDAKPVLWVSLTESGRGEATADSMQAVGERLKDAVGGDYHVIVADDRTRLATQEDLVSLRDALNNTLPSDIETEAERAERQADSMGLTPEDVMGGDTDAPGVQERADSGDGAGAGDEDE